MSICTRFGFSDSHNSLSLRSLYHVMDPGHPFELPSVLHYSSYIESPYRTAIARQDTCNRLRSCSRTTAHDVPLPSDNQTVHPAGHFSGKSVSNLPAYHITFVSTQEYVGPIHAHLTKLLSPDGFLSIVLNHPEPMHIACNLNPKRWPPDQRNRELAG